MMQGLSLVPVVLDIVLNRAQGWLFRHWDRYALVLVNFHLFFGVFIVRNGGHLRLVHALHLQRGG